MPPADRSTPWRGSLEPAVVSKALQAGAQWWLDSLDCLVRDLEREWGIAVGRPLAGGTEAFVAEAAGPLGEPAVLKLVLPRGDHGARDEITTLRLAAGDGCVCLLAADVDRGALLLERLGPSLAEHQLPFWERQAALADLAASIWRPAPDSGLRTGAEKARWLVDFIEARWSELGEPCSREAIGYAVACAERRARAHTDTRAVLVHGDVHAWNALSRPGGGFALVDPDGLLAEPEYDLGVLLREDPDEFLTGDPWHWAEWLAGRTGTDPAAIWEWGAAERVSTGLLLLAVGLTDVGRGMLDAAERAASGPPVSR